MSIYLEYLLVFFGVVPFVVTLVIEVSAHPMGFAAYPLIPKIVLCASGIVIIVCVVWQIVDFIVARLREKLLRISSNETGFMFRTFQSLNRKQKALVEKYELQLGIFGLVMVHVLMALVLGWVVVAVWLGMIALISLNFAMTDRL